ncbi:3-dehydroquinate synthase [Actinomyces dentalis]|uniref:3-dehydroquinate synthase n=1 Tax=Actinomyces dentalis TaxID=272548 RepID=UPI00040EB0B1|nr:3-dehydroquinate synthase [Actinomyces dentalis]
MTPRHRPRITLADVRLPLLLVGLPGAGKTTVARLLAAALGVQATDTDAEIRRRARMTIPQIFAREGEESFRDRETRALRAVLGAQAGAQGVVALGGGAVLREENRALLAGRTVIHLSASPSTAAAHVGDGAGRPVVNPAADSDAVRAGAGPGAAADGVAGAAAVLARMEALHAQRGPLYAQVSTLTVPTDGLTPEQVAALVLVALGAQAPDTARALSAVARPGPPDRPRTGAARRNTAPAGAAAADGAADAASTAAPASAARGGPAPGPAAAGGGRAVPVPPSRPLEPDPSGVLRLGVAGARPYDVVVGHDLSDEIVRGVVGAAGGGAGGVALIHADALADRAGAVRAALTGAGLRVGLVEVPGGEAAKTAAVLESVWGRLGELRLGRDGAVVGLGGGATTDLAGFAAATWLRGVPVVQVPTTLLAMVDAAIGGKTGIDTPAGKNLVGAFHAPAAVVCDLDALAGLPAAELRAGLGEVVKCGFIADPVILDRVLADPADLKRWDAPVLAELVARCAAVKAAVVGVDPAEAGAREILNYGHTCAHAIERVTGYAWRHGEAVAVGCVFAAEVARALGRLDPAVVALHRQALSAAGLPVSFEQGAGRFEELVRVMASDKKVRAGRIRMVLLDDVARPVRGVVPDEAVLRAAHGAVTGSGA